MKKSFRLLTIIIALSTVFLDGCKKGENDPAVSLKSRKSRATGTWKLASGTLTSSGFTGTFDGSTVTVLGMSSTYTLEMVLEKDGTFKRTINDDGDISIETGTWDFNSGVGEAKKKELILLSTLTYTEDGTTETYSGSEVSIESLPIDELRSKKMVIVLDGSANNGSTTSTTTGTMTFEQ
jgi:hypothetical protein